ncbi:MAG: GNAT family N-acetyltransferase [Bacillaceae bacterium]|nr:GNAT family N-acetyltransferase [Bacillaceae bacterium]
MEFKYFFNEIPDDVLEGLVTLHKFIFGLNEDLKNKISNKPPLLTIIAMEDSKVIGYKIGYPLNSKTFYSWLGGVHPNYRNLGIASMLMEKQHKHLRDNGYKIVQTKTMNKWRNMLILNIKHGFDVIETYTDEKGLHKIVLEKKLND